MNYIKEEKAIDLKELLFTLCLKWRSVISITLLSAVLVIAVNIPGLVEYKNELGMQLLVKPLLKNIILVSAASFVFMVFVYLCRYMCIDNIKSVQDYLNMTSVFLIGSIPIEKKCKKSRLDKFIKRISGIKIQASERDNLIKRSSLVIERNIISKMTGDSVNVAVVSSCSSDESLELFELLQNCISSDTIRIIDAGDIMNSAEAIKIVSESDYIVLAERQGKSKYSEFNQTCKQLALWNKEILGTILLDVDAL